MEQHNIYSTLAHLQGIDQQAISLLASLFRPISLEKGQLLCAPGQNGRSLYLLTNGLLHHYRKNQPSTISQTIRFYLPGSYLGSPAILIPPSDKDYITAIVQSELLTTTQAAIQQLILIHPEVVQALFAINQQISLQQLSLIELLHTQPASLRQQLMEQQLGILRYQIPLQILASYLSISRKHLGRLRNKELRKGSS